MSSFFFFFVFFSLVSFSREKIVVPLLLLFLSLFSVEKIYIAPLSKEVFVRTQPRPHTQREREREKNIRTTYAREVQKERKLSPILLLPSLFSSLLFVSRRGTCVIRL